MALRGKRPSPDDAVRLKALMSGPAGVGKTMAAIQMPKPYVIDTESGTKHYGEIIDKAGGAVAHIITANDVIAEIKSLMTEQHPYLTLVIDPITTVFNETLDEGERKAGTEFGRHYGYANKLFKRLCGLLTALDMNVIITAHEKNEYGDDMKVIGKTFDGYKKLDYIFDLWFQIERDRDSLKRFATVAKTRLPQAFPDRERFEWGYDALVKRYGRDKLERGVSTVALATADQIERFRFLLSQFSEDQQKAMKIDRVLSEYEDLSDMPSERIAKGIELLERNRSTVEV